MTAGFFDDLLWPLLGFGFVLVITALYLFIDILEAEKNQWSKDYINNITYEVKNADHHCLLQGLGSPWTSYIANRAHHFSLHTSKRQLHLLNDSVERILILLSSDMDFILKKENIDLRDLFEGRTDIKATLCCRQAKPTSN